jgi:flavin-dependent dehydrogenase
MPLADDLRLEDGASVAVIGSGPAGSIFAYFLLQMAARIGLDVAVDLYESKQFTKPGAVGCNMCGGIVSESLVQNLATEGINLPDGVVQRAIDSYVLHMDVGSVRIDTPLHEMRIGAVHRGAGPRDVVEPRWESFDRHLLERALSHGARLVPMRVDTVSRELGKPVLKPREGAPRPYDLLAVAVGVNSPTLALFEGLGIGYERPRVTKTLIREYRLGEETIGRTIGTSMHVFLLNIPRLEFAAIIPKGDYVTMCLLGEAIDNELVEAFVAAPEVKACMPPGWNAAEKSCQCMPHIAVRGVEKPYADRVVFVGDCGVTRLYKDGIGAAYRTGKAAARAAVFEGVSEQAFERHYLPICERITSDNAVGRVAFAFTEVAQRLPLLRRALLHMTVAEQGRAGKERRLSGVLWDMFSGSAPYADIFRRMLHPAFIGHFAWSVAVSTWPSHRRRRLEAPPS